MDGRRPKDVRMPGRLRRLLNRSVWLAATLALAIPSAALAGTLTSTGDGSIEFVSRSSQANHVVMLYNASGGVATVLVSDVVPIGAVNAIGCSYPNPADPRTIRCTSGGTGIDAGFGLGPGNDSLVVLISGQAAGTSVVSDGPGNDSVSLATRDNRWFNGPGNDTYRGGFRDRAFGGPGNDVIYGRAGPDRLSGGVGNDRIYGGLGNDVIFGGPGLDRMFGGPGVDRIDGLLRDFALR
jgi:Ca2+-binding RTX toxin-like protein